MFAFGYDLWSFCFKKHLAHVEHINEHKDDHPVVN